MFLATNISFKRSSRTIFKNFNLSLSSNKIIQISGRNGVGKTTLIKILSCIILPTSGEIFWNGKKIFKNLNNFFKNLTLIMDINTAKKDLTVFENIIFWKKIFASHIDYNEIDALLKLLKMEIYKNVMVKNLSYGEIRKLEISRLIIEKRKIWIFDEPYLGLDEVTINILNETLKDHLRNNGMIIFSSHYSPKIPGIEKIQLDDYANN